MLTSPSPAPDTVATPPLPSRPFPWHGVGFLAVLAVTVALRFPLLPTIPVGLHFDEAFSGVDAAAISRAYHPIFFTDSNGMEPLYLYLQALSVAVFGRSPFALRVVSAVLGTLTVPALYLLARRLADRTTALFAAAVLAVTYWHVHVSRLGYRAIALPLFECLAWWALWNGVQKRDWRWLAGGGAFVGVALYTYSTARVFPFAVALWFVWLAARRRDWRPLVALALVGGAALIVFAPLGWYFVQHPEEFVNRVGQVVVLSPGVGHGGQPAVLVGIEKTLPMFSFHGDPQWKYNLSGKPTFDPLMSVFFYAGIVGCIVALGWRRRGELGRGAAPPLLGADAAALALLWFVVMLIPGFVTTDPPETLHTLAVVPIVCAFPAFGAVWLWRLLSRRVPRWRRAGPALAAALVAAEAISTAISYFLIWAPNPQTYYWLHGDVADLARALNTAPANATIYIATQYYRHPTVRFLAPQVAARAIWFEGDKSLPALPAAGPAIYAFANGYQPLAIARTVFPSADLAAAPRDANGGVEYRIYQAPGPVVLPALNAPLNVTLGGDVQLLDATVQGPDADRSASVLVSLRWRVLRVPTAKLSLFVHVLDASGYRWAQSDGQGVFSTDWRPGEVVVTTETVPLPPGTPPAPLVASADFYDVATGIPLATTGGAARASDGGVILGAFTPPPSPATNVAVPGALAPRPAGPGLTLLGAQLPAAPVPAGKGADIVVYVKKTGPEAQAPQVALVGQAAAVADPLPSAALLAALPVGDLLAIHQRLTVPLRDTATSGQLELRPASGSPIPLGAVAIKPLDRQYAAPPLAHAVAVRFGTVAELVGYTTALDPGKRRLTVTLTWKALEPSDTPYTVFVHLVSADGRLVGQNDGPPADAIWPTTAWLAGQYITDSHTLQLPTAILSATDRLHVGLYAAAAPGQPRLPAAGPADQVGPTDASLPARP